MSEKSVFVVIGTRPEAIKMAPIIHALAQDPWFKLTVCVTGQHKELLDQVVRTLSIPVDLDLNLMKTDQSLPSLTSRILSALASELTTRQPSALLVHGDTTTTLAAALAAFYARIPVGHVEAGLRTHNLAAPFPEELNRQLVARISRWHFAPTSRAAENLRNEGIPGPSITVTGNTGVDALIMVLKRIRENQTLSNQIRARFERQLGFSTSRARVVLVTCHRRENFGEGFDDIFSALRQLSRQFPDVRFIFPVHPNPRVTEQAAQQLSEIPNVHLLSPLDYEEFTLLLHDSHIILTDSGGIQEEAPSLGKPVLIMRDATERIEGVEAGTAILVGSQRDKIVDGVARLLTDDAAYTSMSATENPYGDGKATERILRTLKGALS